MKRYIELVAAINTCNYCGSSVITLNDMGQCPKGCPGNMHEVMNDSYYMDMKTGRLVYAIPVANLVLELG